MIPDFGFYIVIEFWKLLIQKILCPRILQRGGDFYLLSIFGGEQLSIYQSYWSSAFDVLLCIHRDTRAHTLILYMHTYVCVCVCMLMCMKESLNCNLKINVKERLRKIMRLIQWASQLTRCSVHSASIWFANDFSSREKRTNNECKWVKVEIFIAKFRLYFKEFND